MAECGVPHLLKVGNTKIAGNDEPVKLTFRNLFMFINDDKETRKERGKQLIN